MISRSSLFKLDVVLRRRWEGLSASAEVGCRRPSWTVGDEARVSSVKAGLMTVGWDMFMFFKVERELWEESGGDVLSCGDRRGGAVASVRVCVERFACA